MSHAAPDATVSGIHHVTAYGQDPQASIDFYTKVLGLRLIKQTVLFNNPSEVFRGPTMYHFYFADRVGTPGTVMTLKPHPSIQKGQVGRGQVTATAFTIPASSVEYWEDRLEVAPMATRYPTTERFGRTVIPFRDHDGQPLELITGESDVEPWDGGAVPAEHGLRGFHGVTIHPDNVHHTAEVLEVLGFEEAAHEATPQDGDWTRFQRPGTDHGQFIDVYNEPNMHEGTWGAGTVHHVALRVDDDAQQGAVRETLIDAGYSPTAMKDRKYFHSIYFRSPSGVNIEIATDGPGFTHDEPVEALGTDLKLPPFLEPRRDDVVADLAEVTVPTKKQQPSAG
jgi:glyoxalase family protein